MKLVIVVVFLHICCWYSYYNGLSCDFTFDDHLAIVNNVDTAPTKSVTLSSVGSLWFNDIWGKDLQAIDSHRSYRPLLILLFRVLRTIHDSPQCLRIVSIEIHTIVSILVYLLGISIGAVNDEVALGSAMLFAVHPVHVEAVTAIVNTSEPAHAVFFVLIYHIYCSSISVTTKHDQVKVKEEVSEYPQKDTLRSLLYKISGVILLASVGVLFKETMITVFGLIFAKSALDLIDILLKHDKHIAFKNWARMHAPWIFIACLFISGYVLFRGFLLGRTNNSAWKWNGFSALLVQLKSGIYLESSELIRKAENPFTFLPSGLSKVISYMYLHFRYMWLLLWPTQLCAEYAFDCISSVRSVWSFEFVCGLSMYVSLMYLFVRTFFKENATTQQKYMQHALLLMIVSFIPASGLFLRLGTLLAERLLYVPSIGFCFLLSQGIHYVSSSAPIPVEKSPAGPKLLYFALVGIICIFYSTKVSSQNLVWKSDEVLHMSVLSVCPRSAKGHLQVAKLLSNKGNYAESIKHIKAAKRIDPDFCDVGYQEALIKIVHDKDIYGAIEAAASNLNCTFSGMGSVELLMKLFNVQLQQNPHDFSILEYHGDVLAERKLPTLASQKYYDACMAAMDQRSLVTALKLAVKLEKSCEEWSKDENLVGQSHLAVLKARLPLISGLTRLNLQLAIQSGEIRGRGLSHKVKAKLVKGKAILMKWIEDNISMLHSTRNNNQLVERVTTADVALGVRTLMSKIIPTAHMEMSALRGDGKFNHSRGSADASESCHINRISNIVDAAHLTEIMQIHREQQLVTPASAFLKPMLSVNLWLGLGKLFLQEGLDEVAERYFSHALETSRERSAISALAVNSDPYFCAGLYFRAQALMGIYSKEKSNEAYVEEAVDSLIELLACDTNRVDKDVDVAQLIEHAREQLENLLQIL